MPDKTARYNGHPQAQTLSRLIKMYDEKADFLHHEREVALAFAVFAKLGLPIESNGAALDVGGGHGMHMGFLAPKFSYVACADIIGYSGLHDGQFCHLLREKYVRNGYALDLSKCAFVETDAMNLLYRDSYFDSCFAFNSFEHIPDPGAALHEIVRVLKPGGCAYISFDPVWTADTGSHFFHCVPEPWAHLIYSPVEYQEKMRQSGASEWEMRSAASAMNRWRPAQFFHIFKQLTDSGKAEVLFHDTYAGLSSDSHRTHPFFEAALAKGYDESELALRRLRWVIRRRPS